VNIRTFQPGDEAAQAEIYNEAAAPLPKFKPATFEEVTRRCRASDFDPSTRFFAEEAGRPVGYATFHPNGRVNYPWCRKGSEGARGPLFHEVLQAMRARGLRTAFAAYRTDWVTQREFFLGERFRLAREMVNFVLDPADLPTRPGIRRTPLTPVQTSDIPALFALAPQCLRVGSANQLEQHLLHNPYFPSSSVFILRQRTDQVPVAAGILVANQAYADPNQVDAGMPCFRLGAFGTEGMQVKRINGLFSFLARDDQDAAPLGLDLLGHAAGLFERVDGTTFAAQVPSDMPFLLRFYAQYFRRQGSFPVYERAL
jgi:hypothetical protein